MLFDYNLPAELFMNSRKRGGRPIGYRRFRTAAEAIRFAVEELPAYPALHTWMNVGDDRFDDNAIRRLYRRTTERFRAGKDRPGLAGRRVGTIRNRTSSVNR